MALKETLLDRMTDMGNEVVQKDLMAMIYAQPGAGKTVLTVGLAKFICPAGKRVLYIDTAQGWVSLKNHPGMMEGVTRIRLQTFGDLYAIGNAIAKKQKGFADIGVVVIDELSTACEAAMDEIWRAEYGIQEGEVSTQEIEGKLYKPLQDATMKALKTFEAIEGLHVIVTAHERIVIDHRKVKVTSPDFTPKNGTGIQKLMMVTAHLTSEIKGAGNKTSYERVVQSHPSVMVSAKSRIGGLPLSTDPGTFCQVIHDWLNDEEATLVPETQELAADDLPDEGVPVSEEADDEPAFSGEV